MPAPRNQPQRPPRRNIIPVYRTGPKTLGMQQAPVHTGGPGAPPDGFVGPTTSAHEWPPYWGNKRIFDPADDPRQPPFSGGKGWDYQNPYHLPNGVLFSVVDFVYYLPGQLIGLRVQTPFFHRGPEKDAYDAAQEKSLSRMMKIVDIYSQQFMDDPTGEAIVRLLIEVLGGRTALNPMTQGTFFPVRANAA